MTAPCPRIRASACSLVPGGSHDVSGKSGNAGPNVFAKSVIEGIVTAQLLLFALFVPPDFSVILRAGSLAFLMLVQSTIPDFILVQMDAA